MELTRAALKAPACLSQPEGSIAGRKEWRRGLEGEPESTAVFITEMRFSQLQFPGRNDVPEVYCKTCWTTICLGEKSSKTSPVEVLDGMTGGWGFTGGS